MIEHMLVRQCTEQRELVTRTYFSKVLRSTDSKNRYLSCVRTPPLRPAQHPCSLQHLRTPVNTQILTGRETAAGTGAAALKPPLLQPWNF